MKKSINQYITFNIGDWVTWGECPVGINSTFPFQITGFVENGSKALLDMWAGKPVPVEQLTRQEFSQTPPGNTGSNCHPEPVPTSTSPASFADGRLVCRLHWLQGTLNFNEIHRWLDLLYQLAELLGDELSLDDGALNRGMKFQHSGHSTKRMTFAWNPPEADKAGFGWLSIPGAALDSIPVSTLREICLELESYGFKSTRLDSAIDDFSKSISPEQVLDCARRGNFAGFRWRAVGNAPPSYRYHVSPYVDASGDLAEATTIYFGSKGSDKSLVYYNKFAESDGAIDSYRFEARHSDEQAHIRFKLLCKAFQVRPPEECLRLIGSFCLGAIDFVDRSEGDRLARHPRFPWWQELIDALGESKPPVPRPIPTIERSITWARRQWETTLAIVREVCGHETLTEFAADLLASGLRRLQPHHIAVIRRAKREEFDLNEFLEFLVNSS